MLGLGDSLTDLLLAYDALRMGFRRLNLSCNLDCPLCGENPRITELSDEPEIECDLEGRGSDSGRGNL